MENRMVLVRTTLEKEEQARSLARRLITERVACCVHVQNLSSIYEWEGHVEEADEWLVEARAPIAHRDAVWDAMLDGHPYQVPLVEVVAETTVPARYARWAKEVTRPV
jgi:periplasmic divalent cation tolerance protein